MPDQSVAAAPKRKAPAGKAAVKKVKKPARWVVYSAPKGGTYKTSTTKNTAVAAAKDGARVATLDLDPQATLTQWHALRQQFAAETGRDLVRIDNYQGTLEDVEEAMAQIDPDAYDVVFVDTPPSVELYEEGTNILLRRADLVLVPTGVGRFDKMSVIPWMGFVREIGCRAAFVLGRVKRRSVSLREAKSELQKYGHIVPHEIPDIEDMHKVDDVGCSVVDVGDVNGATECVGVWDYVKIEVGI